MAKLQRTQLNLTILTHDLAQMVFNLLGAVFPGYRFAITLRKPTDHPAPSPMLEGTYDITAWYEGTRPWSDRALDQVMSHANGAYLMALRGLTEETRRIAVLGYFIDRVTVRLGLQRAALALGAADCFAEEIGYATPESCWRFRVVAESAAAAQRIANGAATACGCVINWHELKMIDQEVCGPNGNLVALNNILVKADWVTVVPTSRATA